MGLTVGGKRVEGLMAGDRRVEAVMLAGNRIWPATSPGGYVADWSSGWGPEWTKADYSQRGSAYVGSLSVADGTGIITPNARVWSWTAAYLTGPGKVGDFEILVGVAAGGSRSPWIIFGDQAMNTSSPSFYIWNDKGGTVTIQRASSGSWSTLVTSSGGPGTSAGWVRLRREGTAIKAKQWLKTASEPAAWSIDISDSTFGLGYVGLAAEATTGDLTGKVECTDFQLTYL